ncbi:MAG: molybdate transport system substrate-binding protein [Kiritimatiellia bacterium]|jgi:molybdate transport system substrate-binding protein
MRGLVSVIALAGCATPQQTVTVLAASSLQRAYTELERRFEHDNPGVDVRLSFAGSQTLATQIRHGIAADVYTSADVQHIRTLQSAGLIDDATKVTCNALVLATSSPPAVELSALDRVHSLIIGTAQVPIGRYTDQLLDAAEVEYGAAWRRGVRSHIVSREHNASLVANKIAMGEAHTAIVYATDAKALRLTSTELPPTLAPQPCYHQAPIHRAPSSELGARWMTLVTSPVGAEIMARYGFDAALP